MTAVGNICIDYCYFNFVWEKISFSLNSQVLCNEPGKNANRKLSGDACSINSVFLGIYFSNFDVVGQMTSISPTPTCFLCLNATTFTDPVFIPKSVDPKTLNLLSNGEIELEEVDEEVKRLRRSISANENDRELIETVNRSRPEHKTVETLVVADHHLMMKHARDPYDVTAYILTVMNVVSKIY